MLVSCPCAAGLSCCDAGVQKDLPTSCLGNHAEALLLFHLLGHQFHSATLAQPCRQVPIAVAVVSVVVVVVGGGGGGGGGGVLDGVVVVVVDFRMLFVDRCWSSLLVLVVGVVVVVVVVVFVAVVGGGRGGGGGGRGGRGGGEGAGGGSGCGFWWFVFVRVFTKTLSRCPATTQDSHHFARDHSTPDTGTENTGRENQQHWRPKRTERGNRKHRTREPKTPAQFFPLQRKVGTENTITGTENTRGH